MQTLKSILIACSLLFVASESPGLFAAGGEKPVVYVIPIHGEINRARVVFVRRGIEKAEAAGADYIIFDIDTFGGAVDSALQITTLIGSAKDAVTIAFVPAAAEGTGVSWSAGALISFACSQIYMAPGTSIGAAAPVFQTQTGMEMAPEKVVSAVRTQMAALAEKNGYPVSVARAMVDLDVELLELYVGDKFRLASRDELPEIKRNAERRGVAVEEGNILSPTGKLLTLTAGQMERYSISSGTVAGVKDLIAAAGMDRAEPVVLAETPWDRAAALVTSAGVTAVLILIGLVALYLEVTSPGFGVPGTIAIVCFAVVFFGSALMGTVGSLELLIFLSGVVLLVVEIFLIPGFGVTGVSGLLLIAASLVLSRQSFIWPEFSWQWDLFRRNLSIVGISLVASIAVFALLLKAFPRLPLFHRLILASPVPRTAAVGSPVSSSSGTDHADIDGDLVGRVGRVIAPLRPVGKMEIAEEIWEVQSDGEFIERGESVEVTEVHGNRLFVRRSEER